MTIKNISHFFLTYALSRFLSKTTLEFHSGILNVLTEYYKTTKLGTKKKKQVCSKIPQ